MCVNFCKKYNSSNLKPNNSTSYTKLLLISLTTSIFSTKSNSYELSLPSEQTHLRSTSQNKNYETNHNLDSNVNHSSQPIIISIPNAHHSSSCFLTHFLAKHYILATLTFLVIVAVVLLPTLNQYFDIFNKLGLSSLFNSSNTTTPSSMNTTNFTAAPSLFNITNSTSNHSSTYAPSPFNTPSPATPSPFNTPSPATPSPSLLTNLTNLTLNTTLLSNITKNITSYFKNHTQSHSSLGSQSLSRALHKTNTVQLSSSLQQNSQSHSHTTGLSSSHAFTSPNTLSKSTSHTANISPSHPLSHTLASHNTLSQHITPSHPLTHTLASPNTLSKSTSHTANISPSHPLTHTFASPNTLSQHITPSHPHTHTFNSSLTLPQPSSYTAYVSRSYSNNLSYTIKNSSSLSPTFSQTTSNSSSKTLSTPKTQSPTFSQTTSNSSSKTLSTPKTQSPTFSQTTTSSLLNTRSQTIYRLSSFPTICHQLFSYINTVAYECLDTSRSDISFADTICNTNQLANMQSHKAAFCGTNNTFICYDSSKICRDALIPANAFCYYDATSNTLCNKPISTRMSAVDGHQVTALGLKTRYDKLFNLQDVICMPIGTNAYYGVLQGCYYLSGLIPNGVIYQMPNVSFDNKYPFAPTFTSNNFAYSYRYYQENTALQLFSRFFTFDSTSRLLGYTYINTADTSLKYYGKPMLTTFFGKIINNIPTADFCTSFSMNCQDFPMETCVFRDLLYFCSINRRLTQSPEISQSLSPSSTQQIYTPDLLTYDYLCYASFSYNNQSFTLYECLDKTRTDIVFIATVCSGLEVESISINGSGLCSNNKYICFYASKICRDSTLLSNQACIYNSTENTLCAVSISDNGIVLSTLAGYNLNIINLNMPTISGFNTICALFFTTPRYYCYGLNILLPSYAGGNLFLSIMYGYTKICGNGYTCYDYYNTYVNYGAFVSYSTYYALCDTFSGSLSCYRKGSYAYTEPLLWPTCIPQDTNNQVYICKR